MSLRHPVSYIAVANEVAAAAAAALLATHRHHARKMAGKDSQHLYGIYMRYVPYIGDI